MSETVKAEKTAKDDQQQFWQMAIETWRASGLSVRQFCTKEGLSEPSFYSWRKKLAGDDSEQEDQRKPESSSFIEVAMPQNDSGPLYPFKSSSSNCSCVLSAIEFLSCLKV